MKNIRNAALAALVLSVIACGSQVVEFPLDGGSTFGNPPPVDIDAGDTDAGDDGGLLDMGSPPGPWDKDGGSDAGTGTDSSVGSDGGSETDSGTVPCDCDDAGAEADAGVDATVPSDGGGGGTTGGGGECEERTRTCYIKFGWCVAACAHSCQVKFPRSCSRRAHCVTECKETCVCSYNECRKR